MKSAAVSRAELKAARIYAIETLDSYNFSLEVITTLLRISPSTVQRYRERLVNRPSAKLDDDETVGAAWIVIIRCARAGIRVKTIAEMLRITQRSVTRYIARTEEYLAKHPGDWHQDYADSLIRRPPAAAWNGDQLRRAGSSDLGSIPDWYYDHWGPAGV